MGTGLNLNQSPSFPVHPSNNPWTHVVSAWLLDICATPELPRSDTSMSLMCLHRFLVMQAMLDATWKWYEHIKGQYTWITSRWCGRGGSTWYHTEVVQTGSDGDLAWGPPSLWTLKQPGFPNLWPFLVLPRSLERGLVGRGGEPRRG